MEAGLAAMTTWVDYLPLATCYPHSLPPIKVNTINKE
jgi:hypothetical protein